MAPPVTATLVGTRLRPEIELAFDWGARLDDDTLVQHWVKALPGRRWDPDRQCWIATGLGEYPDLLFAKAGIDVDLTGLDDPDGVFSLGELVTPIVRLSKVRPTIALVRPRLSGFHRTLELLGAGAKWDKERERFEVPVANLVDAEGRARPGLDIEEDALQAARDATRANRVYRSTTSPERVAAATLGLATGIDDDIHDDQEEVLTEATGGIPDWFALDLYPYQRYGALAAAAGRGLIGDVPGLGKSITLDTRVPTPTGWTTIGDIQPGDEVWTRHGTPTKVIGQSPVHDRTIIEMVLSDGQLIRSSPDHEWNLIDLDATPPAPLELTTQQIEQLRVCAHHVLQPHTPGSTRAFAHMLGVHPKVVTQVLVAAGLPHDTHNDRWPAQEAFWALITHTEGRPLPRLVTSEFVAQHLLLDDGSPRWQFPEVAAELVDRPEPLTITSVETAGAEQVKCILVDHPEHVFLIEDFVPTHNTRQGLAAAAIRDAKRLLVISPPITLSHWAQNVHETGLPAQIGTPDNPAPVWSILPGRKEPELTGDGVVVATDSLLTARPALLNKVIAWGPDAIIYDEAHRARSWDTSRSTVMRDLATRLGPDVPKWCLTGTPLFASPAELAPILDITGHLDLVFGGYDKFMNRYCRRNHFNQWVARKKMLPELRQILDDHVWVRRHKADVLKDLPPKQWHTMQLDIDRAGYRKAHDEVTEKIDASLDRFHAKHGEYPDTERIEAWARKQIGLMSPLRKAAGLAKVVPALEYISEWIESNTDTDGTNTRPLIVWAWHHEVMDAIRELLPGKMRDEFEPTIGIIDGRTTQRQRDALVGKFQAGEITVLICQIMAAGVGITLTAASDALFVETDWVAANIIQAEDRCHRIGQDAGSVTYTTMLANGTLDARIHKVRYAKQDTTDIVLGREGDVTRDDDTEVTDDAPWQILAELAQEQIAKRTKKKRAA